MTNPILESWSQTLARRGEDAAILSAEGRTLRTFAGIEAEAREFTRFLATDLKLPAGTVVALRLGNSPLLPAQLLAIWRRQCVPMLLDRSLDGAARASALETCRAVLYFGWQNPQADAVAGTGKISSQTAPGEPFTDGTEFLKLTSGTTGAARAIRFTAAQLLADCAAVCDTMGITDADVNFGVIPWSHSYGFSNLVTPLLCRGVSVVASEDRLPRAVLDGLAQSGATVFPGVPLFFQKLAELGEGSIGKLRLCISAGAPLAASVASAFRAKFGIKLHSFYGSSECGGIAYDATEEEAPEGFVGQPMRGVQIDFASGSEPGRITVRSAAVGESYFPEPEPGVLGGGAFSPGDLVQRTPPGLVLTGRVSDFINVAGRKLNPATVEAVLRACPGVADAVVFGVPHAHRGEEPVACVAGTVETEALRTFCAKELPGWQMPRDYWRVDALPVNERGKLNRRALAEQYQGKPRG